MRIPRPQATLASTSALRPAASARRALAARRVGAAVAFALLTAAAAQVAIPLPFTPVPLTLQTLVVLLGAVTLGPRWGTLGMAVYLLLGTLGYPAFALGNAGGQTLLGATGGFLLGFVAAQLAVGAFLVRTSVSQQGTVRRRVLIALLAGELVIYACGVSWLAVWLRIDLLTAAGLGFLPFALWDSIKIVVGVELGRHTLPWGRRTLGW